MNKAIKITKKVYSANVKREWNRLIKDDFHQLELDNTSLIFLKRYLPKKGLVLDAGGGPGRYTIELAKLGYDVVLFDLVKGHLELAKKQITKYKLNSHVKEIIEGSITDLSCFEDNSFDAVLCTGGPLSHINPESDRKKAISELIRVAKKDAPIFASVMGKYGVLLTTPFGWPNEVSLKKHFERIVFEGNDYMWSGKGYCHFFTSKELEELFLQNKVTLITKVGLEGLNVDTKTTNNFAKKYPQAWKNWLAIHEKICTEPFVVDASGHMMIIVKKK